VELRPGWPADGSHLTYLYDSAGRVSSVGAAETLADTFTAPNGSAPDGQKWSTGVAGGGLASIDSNRLDLWFTATAGSSATLDAKTADTADSDTALRYSFASITDGRLKVLGRQTSTGSYRVEIRADNQTGYLYKTVGATTTQLGTFTAPNAGDRWLRFRVQGSSVSVRVWADGTAEPTGWTKSVTDTDVTGPGKVRLQWSRGSTTTAAHLTVDDLTLQDLSSPAAQIVGYSYDADGNMTGETVPSGSRTWSWSKDRLVGLSQTIGGVAQSTTLGYGPAGRLATEVAGGVTTTYTYDPASQLLAATPTSGSVTTYTYDASGRRTSSSVSGVSTNYGYDAAGELTSSTPSSGSATTYGYDRAGREVSQVTADTTMATAYDGLGRVSSATQTTSGATTSSQTTLR